jgi:hypothetical protein
MKRRLVILIMFIVAGCTVAPPYRVYETAPMLIPAFLVNAGGVLAVWHDGFSLIAAQGDLRRNLPLGNQPRDWQVYPGRGDESQLLWLDAKGRETRLYTARLSGLLELLRGPTEVNGANTAEVAAIPLLSDDLLTLWTERTSAQPATPLYLQVIDASGRPRIVTKIADDARLPSLAADSRNVIHATWLEPQIAGTYAIRYAQISNNSIESALSSQPVVVGMVASGQTVEHTALCSDGSRLYHIRGEVDQNTDRGRVTAFAFNVDPVREFALGESGEDGRWPAALSMENRCMVALTSQNPPATVLLTLQEGERRRAERITETPGTLGGAHLVRYNGVWLGWAAFGSTGGALYVRKE